MAAEQQHYWAVRPRSMPEHIRIERADGPMRAYRLAFGRGDPWGAYEAKDLGTRVREVQVDRRRLAALRSPDGWVRLGRPMEEVMAERRARAAEREEE